MDQTKITELEAATVAAKQAADAAGGTDEALNKALADAEAAVTAAKAPSQDRVAQEIERENKNTQRTEREKAEYSLKKNAERLAELGGDPAMVIGAAPADNSADTGDKNRPMTVAEYEAREAEKGRKTALQMADEIENESERELTKTYLGRIIPSSNPAEDLRLARLAVNSVKHGQIAEEASRRGNAASHGTGTSAPARATDDGEFVATTDEASLMRAPFNLSKQDILNARKASAAAGA